MFLKLWKRLMKRERRIQKDHHELQMEAIRCLFSVLPGKEGKAKKSQALVIKEKPKITKIAPVKKVVIPKRVTKN